MKRIAVLLCLICSFLVAGFIGSFDSGKETEPKRAAKLPFQTGTGFDPAPAGAFLGKKASSGSPEKGRAIENVFLILIDGLRYSEFFDDPEHRYTPHLWNDIRPLGTMFTKFSIISSTMTTASHATMVSGVIQDMPLYGPIKIVQDEPSVFQYYRSQLGIPKDKTWIINGKGNIRKVGVCLNPLFSIDQNEPHIYNDSTPQVVKSDEDVVGEVQRVIDTYHPSLALINLAKTDSYGHSGDWDMYTYALKKADSYLYDICQMIWQDPYYQDNTAILITTDHGRHLDHINIGFASHGDSCSGCRHVPFLVIGPGIKENNIVDTRCYNVDLASTIAAMLGFSPTFSQGRVLKEMFTTPPQDPRLYFQPAAAASNGRIHMACRMRAGVDSKIIYTCSQDNGSTWNNAAVLSDEAFNRTPSLAAEGDLVAAAWSCLKEDGSFQIAIRESRDNGITWSNTIYFPGQTTYSAHLRPSACYSQGILQVCWVEPKTSTLIHMVRLDNGTVVDSSTLSLGHRGGRIRCAQSANGTHVVYEYVVTEDGTTDIYYTRFDGSQWLTPVQISDTPDPSVHPDIAFDESGIHIIWTESYSNIFKVVVRNSADGTTWDDVTVIDEPTNGAWHPRIISSDAGLVAVWEDYQGAGPAIRCGTSQDGGSTWCTASHGAITGTQPALAIDGQDLLHLFWVKYAWPMRLDYKNHQL